ncbi:uncharacterized protein LOC124440372 isoform X2 [Xenia sp. Carnegie-2017]|uniref:uncharacterized protein LOC124440372 isoform X2 n=1 Tax=Xenia sp. Carnegie-2017 TaxID=2897299 RepID=UPI001F048E1E|nr:uncharacterized protein LOC124440372 isoform X2 [Xenia sp. Carnegie-2017]
METNIRTVFETIGHIKKSLQCSICFCIKKFIDEKKGKTHLIYCPLCKNPITKRGLTPNPKLKEIVHVIHKLNSAFCEDAGLPDSPYPIIKPAVNNLHYDSSQTPIKSVNHCKSEDGNKQRCSSVINTSLSSTNHLKENKTSSPQRIPCKQTFSEILSLLDCEEEALRSLTKCDGKETESNKCLSQKNDKQTTQRCNATSSQLNVNKSGDNSSGSITVDEENVSQHSTLSENSVSLLDNLFLQESTIELSDQDVDHSSIANHTKGQNSLQKETNTCSYEKISKKAESSYSENIKEKNNLCFNVEKNELSTTQIEVSKGEEIKREENYQLSEKRVSNSLEANAETIETVDQENAIIDCYETGVAFKVTPPLLNSASVNADELNLNNGLSNVSERIPASVESDTETYRVIPLPCHNRYDSHDEIISPEFPKVMGIPLESEKGNDENINSGNLKQSLAESHQLCFDQSTQAIPNSSNLLQVHHESSASSFQERQKIGSSPSRENNRLNFQHSINNNHFYDNDVGVNEREEASITLSKIPIVKNSRILKTYTTI